MFKSHTTNKNTTRKVMFKSHTTNKNITRKVMFKLHTTNKKQHYKKGNVLETPQER